MGGGTIAGIGYVSGVRAMITASDSGIKGGTIAPMGLKKSLRAQEIALRCKLPLIALVESGGANLNYQAEIFVDGGRTFANMARLSAAGIPHITVVHGSSTAGGAYHPGLSDYVVVVKKRSKIFLAGPPLLKAATGEIATDEELGGAEMHAMVSGVAEYLAEDDADALQDRARDHGRHALERAPAAPAAQSRQGAALQPRRAAAASSPSTTASPTTCARSSPASSTTATSSTSSRSMARRPCAATRRSTARPSASSATTARSTPRAPSRPRSSSSCATRPTRRSCSCRTPPATWSAATPSAPASSSTAPR